MEKTAFKTETTLDEFVRLVAGSTNNSHIISAYAEMNDGANIVNLKWEGENNNGNLFIGNNASPSVDELEKKLIKMYQQDIQEYFQKLESDHTIGVTFTGRGDDIIHDYNIYKNAKGSLEVHYKSYAGMTKYLGFPPTKENTVAAGHIFTEINMKYEEFMKNVIRNNLENLRALHLQIR